MVDRASLDDSAAIAAADPGGMLQAVAGLGEQLRTGFHIGAKAATPRVAGPTAMVVCGMGGSGIAGDVVRSLLGARLDVPFLVSKADRLPAFCGPDTLVFPVSYSGGTQETLRCLDQAIERGCRVVSIGAGGPLAERAGTAGAAHLEVPGDAAVPRAALGYLAGALLGWLDRWANLGLAADVVAGTKSLHALATRWSPSQPAEGNDAKIVAGWLLGRIPVMWGSSGLMEAAALRFKNQVNENAKVPAFHSVLPELDHNEIEGWAPGAGEEFAIVALRHDGEPPDVADRFDASLELVKGSGVPVREFRVEGRTDFERLFGTILLGDFASAYLAILRGIDPTPIPVLTGLKTRLAR
jgi:glucose/mannose-6-phosphate isomerase